MVRAILLLGLTVAWATTSRAQDPQVLTTKAPPPAKVISREERQALDSSGDHKSRVKRTIELAESRLEKAELHTTHEQFNEATSELGRYWALVEDGMNYLGTLKRDSNKTRDLYKRLELALRAHGTRLTLMRRNTAAEYAVWIKELEDFTRNSRTEALNSFYGHTVVRERDAKEKERAAEKTAKDGAPQPPQNR